MQILLDCAGDLKTCCNDYALASVLGVIKQIIDLLHIIIPIFLIVMVTFNFIQLMSNPEDKKAKKAIINRFLAAVIVFFVPTIINIILGIMPLPYDVISCWNNGNKIKEELKTKKVLYVSTDDREKANLLVDPSDYEKGEKPNNGLNFKNFKHLERYYQVGIYSGRDVCASGKTSTVGRSACGLSTYMAVRYVMTGKDTDFMDFCHEACRTNVYRGGASNLKRAITSFYSNKYGFKLKEIGNSYNEHISELKKGNVVITAIECDERNVEVGGFNATGNGHYIALIQYDEKKDRIYVFNPAKYNNGWTKTSVVDKFVHGCVKYSILAYK